MLRRNVNNPGGDNHPHSSNVAGGAPLRGTPPRHHSGDRTRGPFSHFSSTSESLTSPRILVFIALVITILTYWPQDPKSVPHSLQEVEEQAGQMAHDAEQRMMEWWVKDGRHSPPIPNHPDLAEGDSSSRLSVAEIMKLKPNINEASARMLLQDSRWVDGEKALKKRLKKLAERQAAGKDIGVPVLTRWLGEDFPAWPTEHADKPMDERTWRKKVEEKYAKMKEEEDEWRQMVIEHLEQESERG